METTELKQKSKWPSNTASKHQCLPAWEAVLTARTVLPTFFIVGVLFLTVGVTVANSSEISQEIIDYTDCRMVDQPSMTCAQMLEMHPSSSCECRINFMLHADFVGDVYIYYGLTNYHFQNNAHYVKSRDDDQLLGYLSLDPSTDCVPFAYTKNHEPIAPCGAIANSMFNDSFTLLYGTNIVPLLNTGIAQPSDKTKFRNPPGDLRAQLRDFAKPIAWQKELWELDPLNSSNNGFQNEDFIVWMHTETSPDFRKLFRRLDTSEPHFKNGLAAGVYTLIVNYQYPVTAFNGTKKFYLTTAHGRAERIRLHSGELYLFGVALLLVQWKYSESSTEMIS